MVKGEDDDSGQGGQRSFNGKTAMIVTIPPLRPEPMMPVSETHPIKQPEPTPPAPWVVPGADAGERRRGERRRRRQAVAEERRRQERRVDQASGETTPEEGDAVGAHIDIRV